MTIRNLQLSQRFVFNMLSLPPLLSTHPQKIENSSQAVEIASVIIYQVLSLLRKVQGLLAPISLTRGIIMMT